eukprot:7911579-Pyramimonas_sp.AAC.1
MEICAEREGRNGTCHMITYAWCFQASWILKPLAWKPFSGTARRPSQRLLASTAACKKQWVFASLDINMASLKGLADQELAEATGEKERVARFTLPPGSATVLRTLPGFERYD